MVDPDAEGPSLLPFDRRFLPTGRHGLLRERATRDPEGFWGEVARETLQWDHPFTSVLSGEAPFWRWFPGGRLNACTNAVDRHVAQGHGDRIAYHWEGERGERRSLTYRELQREVERAAGALQDLGLVAGDRIALYLPMIMETPVVMLAAARIGVAFTMVFSGFSATALAERINDSGAKAVVTASLARRRGKTLDLKGVVDEAVAHAPSVRHVLVVENGESPPKMTPGRDRRWREALDTTTARPAPVPLPSDSVLFLLYTSGTTGRPKGVVHGTGGYLTQVAATMDWVFDARPGRDVFWCAADIGWVTGHSYIVFGPLMAGLTSLLYEGALDHPGADRIWALVERYRVTTLYTSPTALRSLMRHGDGPPAAHDLSSLRLLGSVGEPINPAAWEWYFSKIGGARCPLVDTWWQTETGGIMVSPAPGLASWPLKPGSATRPLPGIEIDVVDESGRSLPAGEKGLLVVRRPWPGLALTLHGDPERFKSVYFSRFPGSYYPGDYAVRDPDGDYWFLGRADEVLKVAGHRLGTIEIEDALVAHPAVAEAAVAGRTDPVKGEVIVAFVTLRDGQVPTDGLAEELRGTVRKAVGPVAVVDHVHFVGGLPKTRSGKIMRRVIRAVANGQPPGDVTTLEDGATVEEVRRAFQELRSSLTEGGDPSSPPPPAG